MTQTVIGTDHNPVTLGNNTNYVTIIGAKGVSAQAVIDSGTDGATDVEIQAGIDGLTSGRTWKEKVVIKGDFTISAPITVPSYTILEIQGSLTGTSANNSVIENDSATNTDIDIIGGFIDVDNTLTPWNKKGITLTGVTRATIRDTHIIDSGSHCINIVGCNQFLVENNILENFGDDGISLLYSYDGRIVNNQITGGSNNDAGGTHTVGTSGIEVEDGSHDISISGNIIEGLVAASGSGIHVIVDGAGIAGCYNLTIANNITKNNESIGIGVLGNKAPDIISALSADGDGVVEITSAGHLMTTDGSGTWKVIIEGVSDSGLGDINGEHIATYVDANTVSIPVTATGTYTSGGTINYDHNNITISGNVSELDDVYGMRLAKSSNLSIVGNSIAGVITGSGISVGTGCKNSQIIGNAVNECGEDGIAGFQCENVLITNNTCKNSSQAANGNYEMEFNDCTNLTISNNQCIYDGVGTAPAFCMRILTSGGQRIFDNELSTARTNGGLRILAQPGDIVYNNAGAEIQTVGADGATAISPAYHYVRLNNSTVGHIIAATMPASDHNHAGVIFTAKATAAPDTAHTITLDSGTWDGTNTVATFNANGDKLVVRFDDDESGVVLSNTGVVLS